MPKFYDLYKSFDDFYDTLMRGNEVEFIYNDNRYFILPIYKDKSVFGVWFGKEYSDPVPEFYSKEDLLLAKIDSFKLKEVLDVIEIVWYNFI